MAITAEVDVPGLGISANYHRISQMLVSYDPDPMVTGSVGTLVVTVVGYPSEAMRQAGRGGISKQDFLIRFGANITDTLNDARPEMHQKMPMRDDGGSFLLGKDGSIKMETVTIPARPATPITTISSDEPTRAEIYTTIMRLIEFSDGQVV